MTKKKDIMATTAVSDEVATKLTTTATKADNKVTTGAGTAAEAAVDAPGTPKRRRMGRPNINEEEYARIGTLIRKQRKALGLEQQDIAEAIGYTKSAVGNWELGFSRPDIIAVPKLCKALKLSLHELMGMESDIILPPKDQVVLDVYRKLIPQNQRTVLDLMAKMVDTQDSVKREQLRTWHDPHHYSASLDLAAGNNIIDAPDSEDDLETVYTRTGKASAASDWIMKVNGDSMEPDYPKGCFVYVSTEKEVELGEVGVFLVDNSYVMKELREDGLYSLNRKRKNYIFTGNSANSEIKAFGCVMGIVEDGDMVEGQELVEVAEAFENKE